MQQLLPAAPQRLRIRRRSMRLEAVELLAVLDSFVYRPACQSRKSRNDLTISVIAELRIRKHITFDFFKARALIIR